MYFDEEEFDNLIENLQAERYDRNPKKIEHRIEKTFKFSNLNNSQKSIPITSKSILENKINEVNLMKGNIFNPKFSSFSQENKQSHFAVKKNLFQNNLFQNNDNRSDTGMTNNLFVGDRFKFKTNSSIDSFSNKSHITNKAENKFSYLNLHTKIRPNFKDSFTDVLNKSNSINRNDHNLIFKNNNKTMYQTHENQNNKDSFDDKGKGIKLIASIKPRNGSFQIPIGGKVNSSNNKSMSTNFASKIPDNPPNKNKRNEAKMAPFKNTNKSFNFHNSHMNNVILFSIFILFINFFIPIFTIK